jgi:hypothetical protein
MQNEIINEIEEDFRVAYQGIIKTSRRSQIWCIYCICIL